MLRLLGTFWALLALALFTGGVRANDKDAQDNKPQRGEISNVAPGAGTLTVKLKDKDGKEVEKIFKLVGEVRYMDSLGRAANAKIFRAGDQVAVIINRGRLEEMTQMKRQP
jgi:hypothetical protein